MSMSPVILLRPLFEKLFDKIIVLSLPASMDRRAYITKHLLDLGILNFEFFDATDGSQISDLVESGMVAIYPPCFRCGLLDCGMPDCNNFLIPSQIAVFASYHRLWRYIAEGEAGRILILEDDVVFHSHAARVLSWVTSQVEAGKIPFATKRSCLLRFGWARCVEHENSAPTFRAEETVRMSNPCHAITRPFAEALLNRFTKIDTTADIFQHQIAPLPGEAYTIFPPIASELSWTDGAFDSTIHPKPVRAEFLLEMGDSNGAATQLERVKSHVKKKTYRPILVTGHPRCGTGYASSLCRQLGLDVGHENFGSHGISSWMFAVNAISKLSALHEIAKTRDSFAWTYLLMPVRDLRTAVPSVMRDSEYELPSFEFRREQILANLGVDLYGFESQFVQAIFSITCWTRIILSQSPDLVWRIEDESDCVRDFLINKDLCDRQYSGVNMDLIPSAKEKLYSGVSRDNPAISASDWTNLDPSTRGEILWYCDTFGYVPPWSGGDTHIYE